MYVRSSKNGFTLIELLVVISIISLLLSILMPSLNMVKEQAKKVVCGTQLKQIAVGIFTYASMNADYLPVPSYTGEGSFQSPYLSYLAYSIDKAKQMGTPGFITSGPYNLAYLHDAQIIEEPKVFYCPSAPDGGDGSSGSTISFRYRDYSNNGSWPWNNQEYHDWVVRAGYNYVPQATEKNEDGFHKIAKKSVKLARASVVCTDTLKSLETLPHKQNSRKGKGINVLISDGSVAFKNEDAAFESYLWEGPPNGSHYYFRLIIELLEGKTNGDDKEP